MSEIEDRLARLEAVVFPEKVAPRLVSLIDWNRQQMERHRQFYDPGPRKNGIACPDCGTELLDSNPHFTLSSSPPKAHIHCEACGFKGYRCE